jgi:chromosome segregation ATPase
MNSTGVFKDNDYLDDKDQEIKWLEQSYETAQANIVRLNKSLDIKNAEIEVLKSRVDNERSNSSNLRNELSGKSHRLNEIKGHWLYKFHKGITNLHKVRLHVKE